MPLPRQRLAALLPLALLTGVISLAASLIRTDDPGRAHSKAVVYGTVTEWFGEPIIGANVAVYRDHEIAAGTQTDFDGNYRVSLDPGTYRISFAYVGYEPYDVVGVVVGAGDSVRVGHKFNPGAVELDAVVVTSYRVDPMRVDETTQGVTLSSAQHRRHNRKLARRAKRGAHTSQVGPPATPPAARIQRGDMRNAFLSAAAAACLAGGCTDLAHPHHPSYAERADPAAGEDYGRVVENRFTRPTEAPLSTFGADVDVAAYANVRRFLNQGQLPPPDAARTEELVNYFDYAYPQPAGEAPAAFTTSLTDCPWNPEHRLLRIGVQARELATEQLPPSNLVFLVDVSGSMQSADKLPLLKQGLRLLVERLRPEDRVSIVVYAGAAGAVLEPTPGDRKADITDALERLRAGGSTAGAAGIHLAYELAERHFVAGGNNRVILATDGDFNVGTTANENLERLIARKRETGVFLSVLGFGTGNYQDARMQTLAEHGNGNAAYVDKLLEARKVLVEEFGGTLFTVAKDVKLQVEFNPARVAAYRLLGYESRLLAPEDFNDDAKDAGDMGSGHTVTALYELIPTGSTSARLPRVDALKYQRGGELPAEAGSGEWATVRMKYKAPDARRSAPKVEATVAGEPLVLAEASADDRWAAAVAYWSLLLRDSDYLGAGFGYEGLLTLAQSGRGADERGYRAEALRLMATARDLAGQPDLVEVEARR